ncbi:hypothetical protein NJB85_02060 [Myroides odoratimimus]|uniref:hypothetical protein n=1 Tax=Myroides odoratimimus TaxID=76832 RepID=UPI0020983998|nr:hypothetical protein [Myroides odoratimimus]MCO7721961.1 hypothetical protein [Myroides odoratimimus]
MIKRHLQEIADMHKVEYSEVKEIFRSMGKLILVIIIAMISLFLLGYSLGTLN